MRCLVTGAAGFLGSHLLTHLLQSGSEVTVLLRASTDTWRIQRLLPQTQVISYDLANVAEAEGEIVAARPEVVFHLAWAGGSSGRHQNDLTQIEDNLPGAIKLLQISAKAGVRRWIGFGSAFEYGKLPGVLTELTPPQPNTLYAISKYALCLTTAKMCALLGIESLWVRPFATYGSGDDPRGLIPFVAQALLRGERPALTGGEQEWDYLHVDDAARALVVLASVPDAEGIFNLASGTAQTVRSLVERLRDQIDPALPLGFGEIPYHPDQIMHLRADVSKLRRLTNWSPQMSLEEGLKRIIAEYAGPGPRSSRRQP